MELDEAYRKLAERQREVEEKLKELARLGEQVMSSPHQFRRVETERYRELCRELEAALDDHASARARFARLLQGE